MLSLGKSLEKPESPLGAKQTPEILGEYLDRLGFPGLSVSKKALILAFRQTHYQDTIVELHDRIYGYVIQKISASLLSAYQRSET